MPCTVRGIPAQGQEKVPSLNTVRLNILNIQEFVGPGRLDGVLHHIIIISSTANLIISDAFSKVCITYFDH